MLTHAKLLTLQVEREQHRKRSAARQKAETDGTAAEIG